MSPAFFLAIKMGIDQPTIFGTKMSPENTKTLRGS